MSRYLNVRIDGNAYRIPEMWLIGAERQGKTVLEAIQYWHEQAVIARRMGYE